jgi:NAD(P)-dependent dehydrogenase (short-subunit alcohol dehydrogenase family)
MDQSLDDIQSAYDTNVFGAIRVTKVFAPLLKAAGQAAIVMVTSGLDRSTGGQIPPARTTRSTTSATPAPNLR